MSDYLEYNVRLTDVTLAEADGDFNRAKEIMDSDPFAKNWVIRSDVGIENVFGYNQIECQFNHDGRVYILDYTPMMKDVFYNVDIRCLCHWCQHNGWKKPEPAPALIGYRQDYWKHQWQTHVVDSEYLDKKFGKRPDEVITNEQDE